MQTTERESGTLAGIEGTRLTYTYSEDGQTVHVSAVAVSSPTTGLTYLVTAETQQSSLGAQTPTFELILQSFQIEG